MTLCHALWLKARKRVKYIWVPEIVSDAWVGKGHTKLNIKKKKMWTNQELYQKTIKVEPLKTTSPENCNFMTYFDTNSHLATKPHKMTSNITEILKALSSIMESYRMICKPEACNQARISISKALQLIYSITKNHHTKIAGLSQIL